MTERTATSISRFSGPARKWHAAAGSPIFPTGSKRSSPAGGCPQCRPPCRFRPVLGNRHCNEFRTNRRGGCGAICGCFRGFLGRFGRQNPRPDPVLVPCASQSLANALTAQASHRFDQPLHGVDALLEGGPLGLAELDLDDPLDAAGAQDHRHADVIAAHAVLAGRNKPRRAAAVSCRGRSPRPSAQWRRPGRNRRCRSSAARRSPPRRRGCAGSISASRSGAINCVDRDAAHARCNSAAAPSCRRARPGASPTRPRR